MAGDWIKMRPALLTSPKVNGIARELERNPKVSRVLATGFNGPMSDIVTRTVMRSVTIGALLVVWGAANEHTKDGVFHDADLSDIDDMVGIPGFGMAMEAVGWLHYDDDNCVVTLPNFDEYNTTGQQRSGSAKTAAERQKEYRDRKKTQTRDVTPVTTSDVTSDVTSNRREEKRREEVDPMSSSLRSEDIPPLPAGKKKTFNVWLADAKAKGEKAISDYRPVWEYAERVGIPGDWIEIAWVKFRERYGSDPNHKAKRYIDWRRVFLNAVEDNWFSLWWAKDGKFQLSTVGQQADIATREAA